MNSTSLDHYKKPNLSRDSGNPVLVMGDFNIGGPPSFNGNAGYHDIMRILGNPRDLWLEMHPSDNGYTYDCANPTGEMCDYQERLDYLFVINSPWLTKTPYDVVIKDIRVVRWRLEPPLESYFVSDHYGLEATLEFRE